MGWRRITHPNEKSFPPKLSRNVGPVKDTTPFTDTTSLFCVSICIFLQGPQISLHQWFPTSGRDPNQGCGWSDVRSRDGFMENSIIMKRKSKFMICNVPHVQYFTSFYLEANDLSNQHMNELLKQIFVSFMVGVFNIVPKTLDLTSNIKNLIFFK